MKSLKDHYCQKVGLLQPSKVRLLVGWKPYIADDDTAERIGLEDDDLLYATGNISDLEDDDLSSCEPRRGGQ